MTPEPRNELDYSQRQTIAARRAFGTTTTGAFGMSERSPL